MTLLDRVRAHFASVTSSTVVSCASALTAQDKRVLACISQLAALGELRLAGKEPKVPGQRGAARKIYAANKSAVIPKAPERPHAKRPEEYTDDELPAHGEFRRATRPTIRQIHFPVRMGARRFA